MNDVWLVTLIGGLLTVAFLATSIAIGKKLRTKSFTKWIRKNRE